MRNKKSSLIDKIADFFLRILAPRPELRDLYERDKKG